MLEVFADNGEHGRSECWRKVVGQHRERGRRCAGLADPDAVGRKRGEALRGAR